MIDPRTKPRWDSEELEKKRVSNTSHVIFCVEGWAVHSCVAPLKAKQE